METIRIIEYAVSADVHWQITDLHNACFKSALPRSYFKQLPHFRYVVFEEDTLVARMGVNHRVIRVGDYVFTIFGV